MVIDIPHISAVCAYKRVEGVKKYQEFLRFMILLYKVQAAPMN